MYSINRLEFPRRGWLVSLRFHHGKLVPDCRASNKAGEDVPTIRAVYSNGSNVTRRVRLDDSFHGESKKEDGLYIRGGASGME